MANVVMCLLVVFIHVSSEPVDFLLKDSWQYVTVATAVHLGGFAVPGFIFLSGLKSFLHHGDTIDYLQFYKRRFITVMVPYLLWFCVYCIYFYIHNDIVMDVGALAKSFFLGTLVSPFYFVVVIAEFYMLMPLWRWWLKRSRPFTALFMAFVLMMVSKSLPQLLSAAFPAWHFPPQNVLFSSFLVFWVGGCLAGKYYELFFRGLFRDARKLLFLFPALAAIDTVLWLSSAEVTIPIFWLNLARMSYCALAICVLLFVAKTYQTWSFLGSNFFKRLDRAAYLIFLSHSLVIFMVNRFLDNYAVAALGPRYLIRVMVTYSVTVALCVAWQRLKERLFPLSAKK